MSPQAHDKKIGALSHLSHAAVFALVKGVNTRLADADYGLAGTGYWDPTRIAASDPNLWAEILLGNSDEVLAGMKSVQLEQLQLIQILKSKDKKALLRWLAQAAQIRQNAAGKRK